MAAIPKVGPGALRAIALLVAGLFVVAVVSAFWPGSDQKVLTASFPRTVSVYEGSDVRVLGVRIGEVTEVKPAGTTVEVTMQYDSDVKVPAAAKAAVVAPSIVGDRFVQLTPVYTSGPVLKDGHKMTEDDTAVPLELDQIYQSLDDLAVSLGPDGANKDGALSRLLDSTARNFGGQGKQFKTTIRDLGQFTSTLDNNKEELFGTAREVERFVKALADNDRTVRDFNDSLASASDLLEGERDDLAAALNNLGIAMDQVSTFVRDNEKALSSNVAGLVKVTDILVRQREALDKSLEFAPVALSNLFHTYTPGSGTLDTRSNLGENLVSLEEDPLGTLCSVTAAAPDVKKFCDALADGLDLPRLPGLPRAGTDAPTKPRSTKVVEIERIDTSLAGLLEEKR
jgi:phospholipid/cholesterol/gamma-HCH transport system substrate-binding protein